MGAPITIRTSPTGPYDGVLIDAPCSGLGVLRRHPDTKWKLTAEELDQLLQLQREILDTHTPMLKPGGTLVYATCSVLPAENEEIAQAFGLANPEFVPLEASQVLAGHGYAVLYPSILRNQVANEPSAGLADQILAARPP